MPQNKNSSQQHNLWNNLRKARIQFNDAQKLHWLQLSRSFNVGPVLFRKLINKFSNAETAIEALYDIVKYNKGKKSIQLYPREKAEREMEAILKCGAQLVCLGEQGYPPLLEYIDSPPPILTLKGRKDLVNKPNVSIVGTRRASAPGIKFTTQLASDLSQHDYVVVSGMARGIDSAAHKASFKTGTIAVLAGGVDIIYPPENTGLYHDIIDNGLIISELPIGTQALHTHFPRRNRIIAGLSTGTIVIESTLRSGSLITAQYALDFNREIFAVPGFPLDPRASGVNKLIKEGAYPITNSNDVLEVLKPLIHNHDNYTNYSLYDSQADENYTYTSEQTMPTDNNITTIETPSINVTSLSMADNKHTQQVTEHDHHPSISSQPHSHHPKQFPQSDMATHLETITHLMTTTPIDIDSLVRLSHLPVSTVQSVIVELEMLGLIQVVDGHLFSRMP